MKIKNIGILLIIFSFLVGTFLTSLNPTSLYWEYFIPALLLGFVGLGLLKSENKRAARSDHRLDEDLNLMSQSMDNIIINLKDLNQQKDNLPTYQARFEIDRRLRSDLDNFAEVRNSMQHLFGLQKYADIMSAFAAGERYVNRVWSASTDGYVDEVCAYLEKAANQFVEAKHVFEQAKSQLTQ